MQKVPGQVEGGKQEGTGTTQTGRDGTEAAQPLGEGLARRAPLSGPERAWTSLDFESVAALAETCAEGDRRYGVDNWMKGVPASNLLNHVMEHLFKLLDGDGSEPHLEHAMWGLGKVRWMARNKPEMVDLPRVRRALGLGVEEVKGK